MDRAHLAFAGMLIMAIIAAIVFHAGKDYEQKQIVKLGQGTPYAPACSCTGCGRGK